MKVFLRKDFFEVNSALLRFFATLLIIIWAICFLAFLQSYQVKAPQFAGLSYPRGASDLLLIPMAKLLNYLLFFWLLIVAYKLIGLEFQYGCYKQFKPQFKQWFISKLLVMILSSGYLLLPFWLTVAYLSQGTRFDSGILLGICLSQCLMVNYAILLLCLVNFLCKQAFPAVLIAILWLLFIWIAASLISSPQILIDMLLWLSPFAHIDLLVQGQLSLKTLSFSVMHVLFFVSLIIYLYLKEY